MKKNSKKSNYIIHIYTRLSFTALKFSNILVQALNNTKALKEGVLTQPRPELHLLDMSSQH